MDIDAASPTPLYHQIAEGIRRRVEAGELREGDTLPTLRDAAEQWGVNIHTVRHAYAELAREGVVETRRPQGTRIARLAGRRRTTPVEAAGAFVARIVREARQRHAMTPGQLAEAVLSAGEGESASRPVVFVVECSVSQCEDHARELSAMFGVDARPWCLRDHDALPEGDVLATYFHYNEVRTRWPRRLGGVRFASIRPDEGVATRLRAMTGGRRPKRVTLCEFDAPTAEAVRADLSVLLPPDEFEVETRVVTAGGEALAPGAVGGPVLFPPRVWGALGGGERAHPRAVQVRYLFDKVEIAAIGAQAGWPSRAGAEQPRAAAGSA